LKSLPDGDIFKDRGVRYKGYILTIARLIVAETKDEKVHLSQIKDFVKQTVPSS
jgi:hypothetical protein